MTVFRALIHLVFACLFVLTMAAPSVFADHGGEKKFQVGDLINCSDTINGYFAAVNAAGEPPTYWGLEQALREKYAQIIKELHAFKEQSFVKVKVEYDDEKDQILIDVRFLIRKVNRTAVAKLHFNQLSSHFNKSAFPVKFEVEFDGAYRFGILGTQSLARVLPAMKLKKNTFFDFDHLVVRYNASGHAHDYEEESHLRLFPEGFKAVGFTLGDLKFSAQPNSVEFTHRMEIAMSGGDAKGVFSFDDLKHKRYKMDSRQKTTCSGAFDLSHPKGSGSLALSGHNQNLVDPKSTELYISGQVKFPILEIGTRLNITDAMLTFNGSAESAKVAGMAVDNQGTQAQVKLVGRYHFSARRFEGRADDTAIDLVGALKVR